MDQCFYLWMSIPAVFCKLILHFYFFHNQDKLICPLFITDVAAFCLPSVSGMFSLPGPNDDIFAVRMEQRYWDSWISSQCNWTQVKRNQSLWEQCAVPGLAWLKGLQRLWRVCECFFFSIQTAPKAQDGYINKFIHILFIHSDSVSLKCSLHV